MSKQNLEVVKRAISAINERDVDAYLSVCTPDFELINPGQRQPITNLYEVEDGRLSRVRVFFDRAEALEAAGLSE